MNEQRLQISREDVEWVISFGQYNPRPEKNFVCIAGRGRKWLSCFWCEYRYCDRGVSSCNTKCSGQAGRYRHN